MNETYATKDGRIGFSDTHNQLIREMIDNGQGMLDDDGLVWADPNDVYNLLTDGTGEFDDIALRYLGLPRRFDGDIELTVPAGRISAPDFQIVVNLYEPGAAQTPGNRIPYTAEACILRTHSGSRAWTMSPVLYTLLRRVRHHASLDENPKTHSDNLLLWAEVRPLAERLGAFLDSVLENEKTVLPNAMKVDIDRAGDDEYRLVPRLFDDAEDGHESERLNDQLDTSFRRHRRVKDVYTIQTEDQRSRVPVPAQSKPALQHIRERQHLTKAEALRIVQNPAEAFDGIDVEFDPLLYSERVKGIGLFSAKAIPFISKYRSEWIPGVFLDESDEGRVQIPLKTTDDVSELADAIAEADESNSPNVVFRGHEFSVDDAREIERVARDQLADRGSPHKDAGTQPGRKVLLIKENIFEDEFGDVDAIDKVVSRFQPVETFGSDYQLKDYQKKGIGWLQFLYEEGASGAVLADDMGLGKTLQVLYFLEWLAVIEAESKQAAMISLLVVPASVMENWEEEHRKFFPGSRVTILRLGNNGTTTAAELLDGYREYRAPVLVISSYETVRSNQILLGKVPWMVVAADEAQRIKNPGSQITNAMKAQHFQFALAITGTPVENSFFDLWCIFDFVAAGLLGTASAFGDEFGIKRNAYVDDPAMVGQKIRERIGGHMIRRRKEDVLDQLPPKFDSIRHPNVAPFSELTLAREMPKTQLLIYRQRITESKESLGGNSSNEALRRIQAIRQVSDHPLLDADDLLERPVDELVSTSARMIATVEALDYVRAQGERAIVFAEFRRTQHLLAKIIGDRFGLSVSIVNGDMPVVASRGRESRQRTIARFNSSRGFNVIVMSPIAAGVGLNVTGANHVIHYSRHWNPARENQATDRAYRIGQAKPVYVYYPQAISAEGKTFDVVINELLQQKSNLASATLYPTDAIQVNTSEVLGRLQEGV